MKKSIYLSFLLFLFWACEEEKIFTFADRPEVFFDKFYMNAIYPGTEGADSTVISFFHYPDGTQDIEIPLVVCLSGNLLTEDLTFGLKAVTEGSTGEEGKEFTLDPSYTFKSTTVGEDAVDIRDTIYLKLHRTAKMDVAPVRIIVELVPGEKLALGQWERRRAIIVVSTQVSQPEWWNSEVTNYLLGKYSEKKFKLFMNEIDKKGEMGKELIAESPDRAIQLVLQFKEWLLEQNPRIYDDENNEYMQVML